MKDIERIAEVMRYLVRGWTEPVQWNGRLHSVRHEPLMAQLGYASLIKATGEPSHGSNPNKAGSRPPGNSQPLDLLDRISEESRVHYRELIELKGHVPVVVHVQRVPDVLHNLVGECIAVQHEHPRTVRSVANSGESWVRSARLLLGYEVRTVMLRDVSCHVCGGALSVPVDASGDVVCVGIPSTDPQDAVGPCGNSYPRWSWVDLLEAQGV